MLQNEHSLAELEFGFDAAENEPSEISHNNLQAGTAAPDLGAAPRRALRRPGRGAAARRRGAALRGVRREAGDGQLGAASRRFRRRSTAFPKSLFWKKTIRNRMCYEFSGRAASS